MNRNGWDTGDRRTDVYIVLLLAAVCLRDVGPDAASLFYGMPSFDWLWLGFAELVSRFGFMVPLFIACGILARFYGVRTAVLLLAAYAVSFAILGSGEFAYYLLHPLLWAEDRLALILLTQVISEHTSVAVLPILTTGCLYRSSAAPPQRTAARLTRLACVVAGLVALSLVALDFAATGFMSLSVAEELEFVWLALTSGSHWDVALHIVDRPLRASFALIMLISGVRLIQGSHLSRFWLWVAIFVGMALTLTGDLLDLGLVATVWDTLIPLGGATTVAAVILWYWWPVLRGRVGPELEPDMPHCPSCGYCVYGIASPRCPECGEPLPATGSAAPEPRTTV